MLEAYFFRVVFSIWKKWPYRHSFAHPFLMRECKIVSKFRGKEPGIIVTSCTLLTYRTITGVVTRYPHIWKLHLNFFLIDIELYKLLFSDSANRSLTPCIIKNGKSECRPLLETGELRDKISTIDSLKSILNYFIP